MSVFVFKHLITAQLIMWVVEGVNTILGQNSHYDKNLKITKQIKTPEKVFQLRQTIPYSLK